MRLIYNILDTGTVLKWNTIQKTGLSQEMWMLWYICNVRWYICATVSYDNKVSIYREIHIRTLHTLKSREKRKSKSQD